MLEVAPGAATDPALADVEAALREVLRFDGYRRVAEAVVHAVEDTELRQALIGDAYTIHANVFEVRQSATNRTARLGVMLWQGSSRRPLDTTINVRDGQTMVVGTATGQEGQPIILIVQASIDSR